MIRALVFIVIAKFRSVLPIFTRVIALLLNQYNTMTNSPVYGSICEVYGQRDYTKQGGTTIITPTKQTKAQNTYLTPSKAKCLKCVLTTRALDCYGQYYRAWTLWCTSWISWSTYVLGNVWYVSLREGTKFHAINHLHLKPGCIAFFQSGSALHTNMGHCFCLEMLRDLTGRVAASDENIIKMTFICMACIVCVRIA